MKELSIKKPNSEVDLLELLNNGIVRSNFVIRVMDRTCSSHGKD